MPRLELHGTLKAGHPASCAPLAAGLPDASPTQRMPAWFPPALVDATMQLQAERHEAMLRLRRTHAEAKMPSSEVKLLRELADVWLGTLGPAPRREPRSSRRSIVRLRSAPRARGRALE